MTMRRRNAFLKYETHAPDCVLSISAWADSLRLCEADPTDDSPGIRRLSGAVSHISGTTIAARTNDSGQAVFPRLHEHSVSLVVRRIGYDIWQGDVTVRARYLDTVEVWLGAYPTCAGW